MLFQVIDCIHVDDGSDRESSLGRNRTIAHPRPKL